MKKVNAMFQIRKRSTMLRNHSVVLVIKLNLRFFLIFRYQKSRAAKKLISAAPSSKVNVAKSSFDLRYVVAVRN